MLDRADAAFIAVGSADEAMAGSTSRALKDISSALEGGDLAVAQKALATFNERKEGDATRRSGHTEQVIAVTHEVNMFLKHFGLEEHVILQKGMWSDEILRAIDLGYEAKMWELTNRIEEDTDQDHSTPRRRISERHFH